MSCLVVLDCFMFGFFVFLYDCWMLAVLLLGGFLIDFLVWVRGWRILWVVVC